MKAYLLFSRLKGVILAMLLAPLMALAQGQLITQEQQEEMLRKEAIGVYTQIFASLKQGGVHKIGQIDLDDLLKDLSQVKYIIEETAFSTQGRLGHRYVKEIKTVFLARDIFSFGRGGLPDNAMGLLLHESLGAAGYEDQKYEISSVILSSLAVLQDPKTTAEQKRRMLSIVSTVTFKKIKSGELIKSFKKDIPLNDKYIRGDGQVSSARGGVSEAGGGGDPEGAAYKTGLVYLLMMQGEDPARLNKFVNDFTIETQVSVSAAVQYYCQPQDSEFKNYTFIKKSKEQVALYLQGLCVNDPIYLEHILKLVQKNL